MHWKKGIITIWFLWSALCGTAQYSSSIGVKLHPGFLIAHREDVRNMEAHTMGYELTYSWNEFKNAQWAEFYRKPEISLSFCYMNLGRPELTGNVYSTLFTFESAVTNGDQSYVSVRLGTGIGYITKKFDVFTNRRNQAIGSHINGAMLLASHWNYNFRNIPLKIKAGLGITHFSNGSFRVPNLGVNMPSLVFGSTYQIQSSENAKPREAKKGYSMPNNEIYIAHAFKERTMSNPQGFQIWNVGYRHFFERDLVHRWRLGGDLFFDKTHPYTKAQTNQTYIANVDDILKDIPVQDFLELGVYGGHMWLISKTHIIADVGFYAYKPTSHKFFTYQRIGFKYHVTSNLAVNFNLKTHFGIADYFSWGIGYLL